jgi:hypothetical protein
MALRKADKLAGRKRFPKLSNEFGCSRQSLSASSIANKQNED